MIHRLITRGGYDWAKRYAHSDRRVPTECGSRRNLISWSRLGRSGTLVDLVGMQKSKALDMPPSPVKPAMMPNLHFTAA
jgi:hypothetical protein